MRDYGTGLWDGGDPDCDHAAPERGGDGTTSGLYAKYQPDGKFADDSHSQRRKQQYRDVCGKCGAHRVDQQLGLEPTPDAYVARMVDVFREVRRVLRDDGTCWVNLGDSYAGSNASQGGDGSSTGLWRDGRPESTRQRQGAELQARLTAQHTHNKTAPGLKPKDLVGIPWRVAFALQADGWYLRADVIWAKPNPMPESVTDRPTKAHEYVFLLSKRPRYFFDQEAVREPADRAGETIKGDRAPGGLVNGGWLKGGIVAAGRNVRSVWEIATQPYPDAHFATFPEELARRCILAGCPEGGTVLDPFLGSGTTAHVARKHGRRCVGVELAPAYADLAARRLQQLSLLAEVGS